MNISEMIIRGGATGSHLSDDYLSWGYQESSLLLLLVSVAF